MTGNPLPFLCTLMAGLLFMAPVVNAQETTEEEEGVLPELGVYISYGEGSINVRLVDNRMRLYFLDAEKKVIEPSYPVAVIRYENVTRKKLDDTLTLRASSDETGPFLANPQFIKPPHSLWINILLLNPDNTEDKVSLGRQRLDQR